MLRGFRPPIVSSGCSKLHRFIIGNGSRECDHEGTHSRFIIAITDTSRDAQASMYRRYFHNTRKTYKCCSSCEASW